MSNVLSGVKAVLTVVISTVVSCLGGFDSVLELLLTLILSDMVSGVILAGIQHKLSSVEFRNGLTRKLLIFLGIFIAVEVDKVIIDFLDGPIELLGCQVCIRTIVVVWFCIEELISILENLANIGLPFPKWVKEILVGVSDGISNTTPRQITNWLKKNTNILNKLTGDLQFDVEGDNNKDTDKENKCKVDKISSDTDNNDNETS